MLRITPFILALASPAFAGSLATPVVGGTDVPLGAWPDAVAVLGERGSCSGTLLAADLVLTAGHCIAIQPTEVVVGTIDFARPGGQRRRVKSAQAYPAWDARYDVGIVMLENPVFAPSRAIAESCERRFVAGTPLQVVGFGLTTKAATDDNTRLHQATIPLVDATCTHDPACAPAIAPSGEFTAGGHGADACFGDSGGPVYIDTPHGPALIGVVSRGTASFGDPCGDGGVYVRADKVAAWIERVSRRKVERVPCDQPADDPGEADAVGCSAGGGVLEAGFAIVFGLLTIGALRRRDRGIR